MTRPPAIQWVPTRKNKPSYGEVEPISGQRKKKKPLNQALGTPPIFRLGQARPRGAGGSGEGNR